MLYVVLPLVRSARGTAASNADADPLPLSQSVFGWFYVVLCALCYKGLLGYRAFVVARPDYLVLHARDQVPVVTSSCMHRQMYTRYDVRYLHYAHQLRCAMLCLKTPNYELLCPQPPTIYVASA